MSLEAVANEAVRTPSANRSVSSVTVLVRATVPVRHTHLGAEQAESSAAP